MFNHMPYTLVCRNAVTQRTAALPGLWQRGFHASAARSADVSVSVPSMGDSISEGTVASLEKKPGAAAGLQHASALPLLAPHTHA